MNHFEHSVRRRHYDIDDAFAADQLVTRVAHENGDKEQTEGNFSPSSFG